MKKILLALTLTLLASPAFAVCGDVNESGDVTAADALAVLKYAVGDDVTLTCTDDFPTSTSTTTTTVPPNAAVSEMRYRHQLICDGKQFVGTLSATSPGGRFSRSANSGKYSAYQRLYADMTPFSGWRMTTSTCGDITWNGSFAPPAGLKIRADVRVQGSTLTLEFFNEGPYGKKGKLPRDQQELLGVLDGAYE